MKPNSNETHVLPNSVSAARLFYFGTLVSSVGSFTLTVALVAFLKMNGYSLATVGLVVALSRFSPVVANFILGHSVDRFEPRRFIFVTEILAAAVGLLILFAWQARAEWFEVFVALIALRAALQGLAGTAIAKVAKGFSVQSGKNTVNALLLSVATHGATLFAGGIAWYAVTALTFEYVIVFDAVTFFVNGALALVFVPRFTGNAMAEAAARITDKFRVLYGYARITVLFDVGLAVSMAGLAATTARLAGDTIALIPVMMTLFGLSFWIASYLLRVEMLHRHVVWAWVTLAAAFFGLGTIDLSSVPALLTLAFVRDTSYALLYTKHTADIQKLVPFA